MGQADNTIALGEAMTLLKDGMEKVAFDVVKFQAMVGDLVRTAGASSDETVIERAQAIDAMAQALFRLSRSTEAIGTALIANGTAGEALTLNQIALLDLRHAREDAAPGGELDLF